MKGNFNHHKIWKLVDFNQVLTYFVCTVLTHRVYPWVYHIDISSIYDRAAPQGPNRGNKTIVYYSDNNLKEGPLPSFHCQIEINGLILNRPKFEQPTFRCNICSRYRYRCLLTQDGWSQTWWQWQYDKTSQIIPWSIKITTLPVTLCLADRGLSNFTHRTSRSWSNLSLGACEWSDDVMRF